MRILIIDDDAHGSEYISTFLQLQGFAVHSTTDPAEGLNLVQQLTPDLVILDILLPDIDGWKLCQQIRIFSDVPILILSGFAKEYHNEIHGLTCGADDYLIKPVDFDLLKAHVTALLRRASKTGTEDEKSSGYVDFRLIIDLNRQQVYVEGQAVTLSPTEYRLLELLVLNSPHTVPTLEIIETVWSKGEDSAASYAPYVRTYIKRLREAIEIDPTNPQYVLNDYGLGYRFVPLT